MSQATTAPSSLVRVSVLSEDRRLDVGIPANVPLVEVIPGFARSLGVLDPSLVHGGYSLRRADGSSLAPALSATAQGVHDGDVLTLVRGTLLAEPRIYDDVTEAVLDATAEQHKDWTPADSARTALAISLTFLALCAVLVLSTGPGNLVGAIVAGGGAVVLLTMLAVLRSLKQPDSANAMGLAAGAFAAIAGILAVDSGSAWGFSLAAGAGGAVVFGGLAFALAPKNRQLHLIPMVWGLVIGIPALITGLNEDALIPAFVLMVAVVGAISNLLPWLAFSSTRIKVISPTSDEEIFATPAPIDAETVKERAAAGARVLTSLRIALGLALLVATPIAATANTTGAILTALVFLGMMFQSRQAYARVAVLVVMAVGAVGLAVTSLLFAAAHPEARPALLTALVVITGILVTLTILSPRARLKLSRLADTAEVVVLAAVLPLGVFAAGLV